MIAVSVVKFRPVAGGIYLASEEHPSAYGLFDCRTRSGGGENALIGYGILQPLIHRTASCPLFSRHSALLASTSSSPKVSMKVCNTGLRSIILARSSVACPPSAGSRRCPVPDCAVRQSPSSPAGRNRWHACIRPPTSEAASSILPLL